MLAEVEVFDPEAERFVKPEAGSVEERYDEVVNPGEGAEHGLHLGAGQHDREPLWALGPLKWPDVTERLV